MSHDMTKIFERLCGLFCACFAVFAALLLGNGYAAALLAAIAVWQMAGRRPLPRFTLLLFGGGMALRVVVLLALHPPVESDFLVMFRAAQSLLEGDLFFRSTAYFSLWAYQSVFVAWEAAWLRLWNDPLCLELVNAVLAAGNICLLYRLARDFASERAARTAVTLLTLSPFVLTMHTVLSNQIPSAFFLTLGLWLLGCADCDRLGSWRY